MTDPTRPTSDSAAAADSTLTLEHARRYAEGASEPAALSAETTSLESLAHHRFSVIHDTPLETVHQFFRERNVEFMALVRDGRVTGLCSRSHLGFMLGSRYGFALYSRSPAHLAQVAHPLVFTRSMPMRRVLDLALARGGDDFHEDVVLVDEDHRLLGLIPTEAVAHLQSRLVNEQLGELRRQHELVRVRNLELFQTNHALRQTRGLYQGLFESDALGVALLDANGFVQSSNHRFAELLRTPPQPPDVLFLGDWLHPKDRSAFEALLKSHQSPDAKPATHELTFQIPNHGPRLYRLNTGWISETSQICVCLEDVTDRRAMERHLRRQEKQLLQLSKPDTGNPQVIDLRKVVEESLVMLKFQIREVGAAVRTHLPSAPAYVRADSAQLKQILMNLAINALQAMDGVREPVVDITVGRGPGGVWLEIKDNGTGIPADILGRIFDPFFTTKSPDKGSGLGLSICMSIARKYGGDISVESEASRGSCFTVSLPEAPAQVEATISSRDPLMPAVRDAELTSRRVLVVEDEDVLRRLLQEIVRSHFGCSVDAADCGTQGLELAERGGYDLVISDIRMPGMTGLELYKNLRKRRPELAKRVLLVSGYVGDKEIDEEIQHWKIPFVPKPFTMSRLAGACLPLLRMPSLSSQAA